MALIIGRLSFDDPSGVTMSGDRRLTIVGDVAASTLAETKHLRDELRAMAELRPLVAVTWTEDADVDGFYRITQADLDLRSLSSSGFVTIVVEAQRLGGVDFLQFQSLLTGKTRANDHAIASGVGYLAPPVGFFGYTPSRSFVSRTGPDGTLRTFLNVVEADDPTWSVAPADYYAGAVEVYVDGRLRAGLHAPNTPGDWKLTNGLVEVTPNATGGRIDVAHHDGTQLDPAKTWRIQAGGADVGTWEALTILRNDPEAAAVRLVRKRGTSGEGRYTLDLALRRGSRFVTALLTRDVAATLKVVLEPGESGTAITGAVHASADDADGNRAVVGSSKSFTADTANTGLEKASVTILHFFLGSAVGGGLAQADDAPADLVDQYIEHLAESVREVRR